MIGVGMELFVFHPHFFVKVWYYSCCWLYRREARCWAEKVRLWNERVIYVYEREKRRTAIGGRKEWVCVNSEVHSSSLPRRRHPRLPGFLMPTAAERESIEINCINSILSICYFKFVFRFSIWIWINIQTDRHNMLIGWWSLVNS